MNDKSNEQWEGISMLKVRPQNGATVLAGDGSFVHHFANEEDARKMVKLNKTARYVIPSENNGREDFVIEVPGPDNNMTIVRYR